MVKLRITSGKVYIIYVIFKHFLPLVNNQLNTKMSKPFQPFHISIMQEEDAGGENIEKFSNEGSMLDLGELFVHFYEVKV